MKGQRSEVTKTQDQLQFPIWGDVASELGQKAKSIIPSLGQSYGGQLSANLSPYEQIAGQKLMDWSQQPSYMQNTMYGQSKGLLEDILSGNQLGNLSEYQKWVQQKAISEDAPAAEAQSARGLARTGSLSRSNAVQQLGDVGESLGEFLAGLRASAYDTERQRQVAAIPAGIQLAQQEQYAPINDINTIMGLGGQFRNVEQQSLDRLYNEFGRARQEELAPLDKSLISQFSQQYPQYSYSVQQGKASPFSNFISPAMQIAGIAGAPFTGGASLGLIPLAQGMGGMAQDYGNSTNSFSQFTNAFAPLASAGMGGMPGMSGFGSQGFLSFLNNLRGPTNYGYGGGSAVNPSSSGYFGADYSTMFPTG